MIRKLHLVTTLLAGGLLFGSPSGIADSHHAPPTPPTPPTPVSPWDAPTPPMPPMPPAPPVIIHHHGAGNPDVSVHIHDGKIEIDGVRDMVSAELDRAMKTLAANKDLPPEIRAKLQAKLERLRGKLERRLGRLDVRDLDRLGEELGQMGAEIGSEMEGFGQEMDKWGQDFGKQFGQDFAKRFAHPPQVTVNPDDDGDDDNDSDADAEPAVDAVRAMGHLPLTPAQRLALHQERDTAQQRIDGAKAQLETASRQLHDALQRDDVSDNDIARLIDAVSMHEAELRKAKILGWRHVRGMLQDDQRKAVERAARSRSH